MLKPLGNNVLVQREQVEEKSESGIILPGKDNEKGNTGVVIAIGSDVQEVKEGDKVVFNKFSVDAIKFEQQEYLLIKESDIQAVIE